MSVWKQDVCWKLCKYYTDSSISWFCFGRQLRRRRMACIKGNDAWTVAIGPSHPRFTSREVPSVPDYWGLFHAISIFQFTEILRVVLTRVFFVSFFKLFQFKSIFSFDKSKLTFGFTKENMKKYSLNKINVSIFRYHRS